eukprot:6461926-Amphidinium_carterae.1
MWARAPHSSNLHILGWVLHLCALASCAGGAKEIRDEKCALRTRSDGALERTVAVVALRLKDVIK